MLHALFAALLLIGWIPSTATASVAGEAVEQSARAVRGLLHGSPEATRLAGRVGQEAVATCGDSGLVILRQAVAAGEDVTAVATQLVRCPQLAGLGLDGVRVARHIGPEAAGEIAALGPRALADAATNPGQAARWTRLARTPEVAALEPAAARRLGEAVAGQPTLLDRILAQAPTIGLAAALVAVGIGAGVGLATSMPTAAAGAAQPLGVGLGIAVTVVAVAVAAGILLVIIPAWRRSHGRVVPLLVLGLLTSAALPGADAWNQLLAIERADREAIAAAAARLDRVAAADAEEVLRLRGGAPSALVTTLTDAVTGQPSRGSDASAVLERLHLAWMAECEAVRTNLLSHELALRVNLPYAIEQGTAWTQPDLPAWQAPSPLVTELDRRLSTGANIRLAATVLLAFTPAGTLAGDAVVLTADEIVARAVATPASVAHAAATRACIRSVAATFAVEAGRMIRSWHSARRRAIAMTAQVLSTVR